MATITLYVPEINYQYKTTSGINYSSTSTKRKNIEMCKRIKNQYGYIIDKYSSFFYIPSGIIIGLIATESSGNNAPPNKYKATGLTQVTPETFYDSFKNRIKSDYLTTEQILLVKKHVPNLQISGNTVKTKLSLVENNILIALQNEEFNIFAGCMYLNYLINRFAISGVAQINKALIGYNAGAYNKVITSTISVKTDSTSLAKNVLIPMESRGYLVKMLGVDGFLDLIFNQKAV